MTLFFIFVFYIFYHSYGTFSNLFTSLLIEEMSKFIVINESFDCENCGEKNPPLPGSCRNHCRKCLFSLHLDKEFPGDRKSECKNLMQPINIEQNKKKGWMIIHKCQKCQKIIPNKAAEDDNFDKIIELSSPK